MSNPASDNVLIGVLSGKNSREHLAWIIDNNCYYMPYLKQQQRQFTPSWLILYIPKIIFSPGAIRYKGEIEGYEVLRRDEIKTGWSSKQDTSQRQILYKLLSLEELSPPIFNRDHRGKEQRISQPRWTTRLSMERAETINELLLESESDWWIYDNLKARGVEFRIKARSSSKENQYKVESRVWFVIKDRGIQIRYSGECGFIMRNKYGIDKVFMYPENMFEHCFGTGRMEKIGAKE